MSSDSDDKEFSVSAQDLEDEFNPNRRGRKFTKDDMIYGVFNDSDSDNEGAHGKKRDYSRPVNFVSSGSAKKGKKATSDDEDADNDSDGIAADEEILRKEFGLDNSDEEGSRKPPRRGSDDESDEESNADKLKGVKRSARTFKAGATTNIDPATQNTQKISDPFKKAGTVDSQKPSVGNQDFAQRLLQSLPTEKEPRTLPKQAAPVMPTPVATDSSSSTKRPVYSQFRTNELKKTEKEKIGQFEEHGKGIGMKLLMKMGWSKGKGIGKFEQGIAVPIEATVRAKGRGITENEPNKQKDAFPQSKSKDSDEEFQEELGQWKVGADGVKSRKPKYEFLKPENLTTETTASKIIDMTGPTARVLGDTANLPVFSTIDASLPMPELQHNIKVIVDGSREDLRQRKRRLQAEKDKIEHLSIERAKIERQVESQRIHTDKLREILGILDECESRLNKEELSLPQFTSIFVHMQSKYYDEYRLYGLANLAIAIAFPLIEKQLAAWNVVLDPVEPKPTFESWKSLLEDSSNAYDPDSFGGSETMNHFEQLCWNVLLPKFRSAMTTWDPRQYAPILRFVESWQPLLPRWMHDNILQQLIFPKLQAEVDTWNPREDVVPIHTWLLPWLPLFDKRMDVLYPQIRSKLGYCLQAWHPSDGSALAMLLPWKGIFSTMDMITFVTRFVSPKLTLCMRDFTVNPSNQSMTIWNWLFAWRELMSNSDLAQILDEHFFPKFLSVLCEWLSSPTVNLIEVSQWYSFWRSQFDADLLGIASVKAHLKRALDIMNRAAAGPGAEIPDASVPLSSSKSVSSVPDWQRSFASDQSIDVRHLVQKLADQYNIMYIPKPGRSADGKALYSFGKAVIYIERDVIFVKEKGSEAFRPVSLEDLVSLA